MNKIICIQCGAIDDYVIRDGLRKYEGQGYHFNLEVKEPICNKCGTRIWIDEIEEEISKKANEIIRKQRDIISKDKILEIVNKYNASQKFLSRILGWGEITLTRYISGGYTPNSENSNKLKSLDNPYIMQDVLIKKHEELDEKMKKSFQKVQTRINESIEEMEKKNKIFNVVDWFLSQSTSENPITHLSLQKLLYFAQGWSLAFTGKSLFNNDCRAWAHGAVYPVVYEQFKTFKHNPLPKVNKRINLEENEIKILEFVKENYLDVYNAKALEYICHKEKPYLDARNGYSETSLCNEIIEKEEIEKYYNNVASIYNITLGDAKGVKKYLSEII